jgi:hypothetical protein
MLEEEEEGSIVLRTQLVMYCVFQVQIMLEEEEEGSKGMNRVAAKVAADQLRHLRQEQLIYREVTIAPSSDNLV